MDSNSNDSNLLAESLDILNDTDGLENFAIDSDDEEESNLAEALSRNVTGYGSDDIACGDDQSDSAPSDEEAIPTSVETAEFQSDTKIPVVSLEETNKLGGKSPSSTLPMSPSVSALSLPKMSDVSPSDDPLSGAWKGPSPTITAKVPVQISSRSFPHKPITFQQMSSANAGPTPPSTGNLATRTRELKTSFSSFASRAAEAVQDAARAAGVNTAGTTGAYPLATSTAVAMGRSTGGTVSSNAVTGAGGQGVLAVMGAGRRPRQSKQQVLGHGNVNVKAPSVTVTPVASSNAGMDNAMKSAVIKSALGKLLPGERVIMFLSHLTHVSDTSTPHTGVGTNEDLIGPTNVHTTGYIPPMVWCCVMTFYRIALFSYCESDIFDNDNLDASVPDTDTGPGSDNGVTPQKNGFDFEAKNSLLRLVQTASVSRQYQGLGIRHRQQFGDTEDGGKADGKKVPSSRWHVVLQMPLASIERVEKTSDLSAGGGLDKVASPVSSSIRKGHIGGYHFSSGGGVLGTTTVGVGTPHRPSSGLVIHGKDNGRVLRFSAPSHTDCTKALEALNTYAFPGRRNLGYLFAFESRRTEVLGNVHSNVTDGNDGDGGNSASSGGATKRVISRTSPRRFNPVVEYARMAVTHDTGMSSNEGVEVLAKSSPQPSATGRGPWRALTKVNASYNLCTSYPSYLVGPATVDDENTEGLRVLRGMAAFRSEGRIPTFTWGSSKDGGSIWRSGQPRVGLQGNRSPTDERYIGMIASCAARANDRDGLGKGRGMITKEFARMLTGGISECKLIPKNSLGAGGILKGSGNPVGTFHDGRCMLKILDLRPKSSAIANRTGGYGYENTSHYRNTEISFHGIGNIHAVRDSYVKLSTICTTPTNDIHWAQLVEETKWLNHIRLILSASWQAAFHVRYNQLPVLIHCSHGWDRTSQVSSLAQILLDGYYRTRIGFSCLIEKDFLAFGHPFHTRCAHGEGRGDSGSGNQSSGDEGQISPIFLQFLDCVFQIVNQYPEYFEFNTKYLLILSEHIYSCRFGTLLCDTERERELVAAIRQRTHCLWEYLESCPDLVNINFKKSRVVDENEIEESWKDVNGSLMMPLSNLLRNVTLWVDRHCMHEPKSTMRCLPLELMNQNIPSQIDNEISKNRHQEPRYDIKKFDNLLLMEAMENAKKWERVANGREKEILLLKSQINQVESKREN